MSTTKENDNVLDVITRDELLNKELVCCASKIPTGPVKSTSVTEALEGPDSDRWKTSMAEEPNGMWEKGTFREGLPPQGTVPTKM